MKCGACGYAYPPNTEYQQTVEGILQYQKDVAQAQAKGEFVQHYVAGGAGLRLYSCPVCKTIRVED